MVECEVHGADLEREMVLLSVYQSSGDRPYRSRIHDDAVRTVPLERHPVHEAALVAGPSLGHLEIYGHSFDER